jgi:fibronectin type 3 domain-containing protein
MKYLCVLFCLTRLLLASDSASPSEPALTAVASQHAIYLYWGRGAGNAYPLNLARRSGTGAYEKIASISPLTNAAQIDAAMKSAADPFSRSMHLTPDFAKKAEEDHGIDEGLALISMGYAQVRGYGYLDRNVEAGRTYHYRLTAGDRVIGEVNATADKATIAAPPDVKAHSNKDAVPVIEWSGQPFTTFEVGRADKPAGPYTKLTLLPLVAVKGQTKLQFADKSAVRDGRTYYYRVLPLDLMGGPGVESQAVSLATLDRTPPRAPAGLRTAATPGGVQLTWQRNQEPDLAGYRLYRVQLEKDKDVEKMLKEARGEPVTAELLPPQTTQFEDTKAQAGSVYSYRISAVDQAGNESSFSPPVLATPKSRIPPQKPSGLGAEVQADGTVVLTWSAGHEKQLASYHLYRGIGEQGKLAYSSEVGLAEKPRFEDHLNLKSQEVYRYAVTAVDESDNESAQSDVISVRLPNHTPPQVPIISGLKSGDGFIEVAWSPVADKDLAGYNVYRSGKSGAPARLNEKLLPAEAIQFRDSKVESGTRYEYSVSAVDQSGNESARSEPRSSATTAKVETPPPSGLQFQTIKSRLYLSWQKPAHAARFIVYFSREQNGEYRQLAVAAESNFMLPPNPTAGWYRVQAISETGTVSEKSMPLMLTPGPQTVSPSTTTNRVQR